MTNGGEINQGALFLVPVSVGGPGNSGRTVGPEIFSGAYDGGGTVKKVNSLGKKRENTLFEKRNGHPPFTTCSNYNGKRDARGAESVICGGVGGGGAVLGYDSAQHGWCSSGNKPTL